MHSYSSFTVLGPCLLTFLPTLRQLAMDITWLTLFVLHIGSSLPFSSCSRLVPNGFASDSLTSRALSGVHSEQGPKPSACAVTRRPVSYTHLTLPTNREV